MFVVNAILYADDKPFESSTLHQLMEVFEDFNDAKAFAASLKDPVNSPFKLNCEAVYVESLTLDGSRAFCNCFMDEVRIELLRVREHHPDWVITNL